MPIETKEIVWVQGQYSWRGTVGGVELFTYFWRNMARGESHEKPWEVRSSLPGAKPYHCKDQDVCRAVAARMLHAFVTAVTLDAIP